MILNEFEAQKTYTVKPGVPVRARFSFFGRILY